MTRVVLVKSYYGWGGDLAVLAEAIMLAKELGCKVAVDWRGSFNNRIVSDNVFDYLFELNVSRFDFEKINCSLGVYPDFWEGFVSQPSPYSKDYPLSKCSIDQVDIELLEGLENFVVVLSRDSKRFYTVDYQKTISESYKCISPKKHLLERIDSHFLSWDGREVIGVHYRHGNGERSVYFPEIGWYFESIDNFLKESQDSLIFICTDCIAALEAFVCRYGSRVVSTPKNYLPVGSGGMHYYNNLSERIASGEEAITDIWLLSKCNRFIGTRSFFSHAANFLGGCFEKSKAKWYLQKHRLFVSKPDLIPVTGSDIASHFSTVLSNLDGLYLRRDGKRLYLSVLYEEIDNFLLEELNDDRLDAVAGKVKSIRLY